MLILVVNAGSSSLKYQVMDMEQHRVLCKGTIANITLNDSNIKQKRFDGVEYRCEIPLRDHDEAISCMISALTNGEHGVVASLDEIDAIGHRVLHGGDRFSASVLVDEDVLQAIRDNIPLGPLHNPANLSGILACMKLMPGKPNVAVFDTAFHQTMPPEAYMYGVPYEYYRNLKVRRYGFHGSSHRYIAGKAAEYLHMNSENMKLICCHLGNGSSLCAIRNGKSVDTSMGMSPLSGLLMGTRCGDIDTTVAEYLMENVLNDDGTKKYSTIGELLTMLNKKSGLLGVAGNSDNVKVKAACDEGNEQAQLARSMQIYGIRKYIGAYAAAMEGVDAIVFTGGIGENDKDLRERVMSGFEWMGVKMGTPVKSEGSEIMLSAGDSRVKVCVIPTDEEMMIARDTQEITEKL